MALDYANAVVAVNNLARKLQKVAASDDRTEIYRTATEIIFECNEIREVLREKPKTLKEYIRQVFP